MNDLATEIYQQIADLLDFNSLVQSTLLCQRWAHFVTSIYPQRLKKTLSKMSPVDIMTLLDFNQYDRYKEKLNDDTVASIVRGKNQQKQFLPRKLILQNEVFDSLDDKMLYRRCMNLTPLWWTQSIKSVHLRNFPLRLCPALLKRFPNKTHFDIFACDEEQIIKEESKPTVEHVRNLLAVSAGCNISINEQRCKYNVLLDDTILELMISYCIQGVPLGSLYLNMRSSVSLRILIRFIEVVSDLSLKSFNKKKNIEIFGLEVHGDCAEMLKFCNKQTKWKLNFAEQMQFSAEFKILETTFNLRGHFHEKQEELVQLYLDDTSFI